ncbi:uncharacterized protein LOC106172424 [Lingula anatina]|uniref:Uncharacterized protein LOC106172424 n=1 Tax=Lingula anatina TaxID=7574 RepID=A0A1S3JDU5_LINAN|nr:uncharacterized protein LOC106172424 [Lingula anatina]|eukprot:XP_013408585.1 uncharacterized protein LOC106172424 [Lingula anatina]
MMTKLKHFLLVNAVCFLLTQARAQSTAAAPVGQGCGTTEFSSQTGVITSPGYCGQGACQYPPSITCWYTVSVPGACKIDLIFTNFDLENGGCNYDFLNISFKHLGSTNSTTFCDSKFSVTAPQINVTSIVIEDNSFNMTFVSDSSSTAEGFRLEYEGYLCTTLVQTDGTTEHHETTREVTTAHWHAITSETILIPKTTQKTTAIFKAISTAQNKVTAAITVPKTTTMQSFASTRKLHTSPSVIFISSKTLSTTRIFTTTYDKITSSSTNKEVTTSKMGNPDSDRGSQNKNPMINFPVWSWVLIAVGACLLVVVEIVFAVLYTKRNRDNQPREYSDMDDDSIMVSNQPNSKPPELVRYEARNSEQNSKVSFGVEVTIFSNGAFVH